MSAPTRLSRLTEIAAPLLDIPYSPHIPTSRQAAFLLNFSKEVLFGGAAGGGKSDAILMAALQFCDVPGYSAIVFRRTYADLSLPGALMDRAHQWLRHTSARWKPDEHTYRFPSGATLTFGYLEKDSDKYRYQGAEFQYVGFDELTQFKETEYRYLFSRLRRPQRALVPALGAVPLRLRAASNPGGIGHDWVYRRFFDEGAEAGRVFIPSFLTDNPHLDQAEYARSLAELDPVTRRQLLHGDWHIKPEGRVFKREWFRTADTAPGDCSWVRYWDLAATDPGPGNNDPDWTAGVLMGRSRGSGRYYIGDVQRFRGTSKAVEARVAQTAANDSRRVKVYIEQEPGGAGKSLIDTYARYVLAGYPFSGHRSTGDKVTRAQPLASQAEAGNILLVNGPWITTFLDEVGAFPEDSHDDQVDAATGAYEKSSLGVVVPSVAPVAIARSTRGWHL